MLEKPSLTEPIIRGFYAVYNELGHGFLESVYKSALTLELSSAGHHVARECPIVVHFRGHVVGEFRADLIVDSQVLVEVKAGRTIERAHESQLLNYLRGSQLEIGLIVNFGTRPSFKRMIFQNSRKTAPACDFASCLVRAATGGE